MHMLFREASRVSHSRADVRSSGWLFSIDARVRTHDVDAHVVESAVRILPRSVPCAVFLAAALMAVTGCIRDRVVTDRDAGRWRDARQLVLVTIPDWNADRGSLRTYERIGNGWHGAGAAQAVTIGRAGAAWGIGLHETQGDGPIKREGDGRSPAGVFSIGEAFGYAGVADTALHYRALQESDYCIDVSGSPLYNRIVDAHVVGADAVAASTEPMRRDLHADGDQRYRLGFVIEHNAQAHVGGGSCIFAHEWKSPTDATAGCTAMSDTTIQSLLAWLRPDQHPIFILLPEGEYMRLQQTWHLPIVAAHR
jgi:L,D-peptidoglycan transpeptidase YkuD (ErfK/YbiS/YcfS/YnhG family)